MRRRRAHRPSVSDRATPPRIIAVVGRSGTGKTTTMEYLIRELSSRGFRVGAVKRIHDPNFTIDKPGKDTFRLSGAGAEVVVSSADKEVAMISKKPVAGKDYFLRDIVEAMQREGIQVVLLEGFHSVVSRRRDIPKIVTARHRSDLEEMLRLSGGPVVAITGIVGETLKVRKAGSKPPILSLRKEGEALFSIVVSSLGLVSAHRPRAVSLRGNRRAGRVLAGLHEA